MPAFQEGLLLDFHEYSNRQEMDILSVTERKQRKRNRSEKVSVEELVEASFANFWQKKSLNLHRKQRDVSQSNTVSLKRPSFMCPGRFNFFSMSDYEIYIHV